MTKWTPDKVKCLCCRKHRKTVDSYGVCRLCRKRLGRKADDVVAEYDRRAVEWLGEDVDAEFQQLARNL